VPSNGQDIDKSHFSLPYDLGIGFRNLQKISNSMDAEIPDIK
jgi:hypothetical protein